MTQRANYALRLQASLMEELKKVVAEEGTTINQFINVAVAEKLAVLRTVDYFKERTERADLDAFWQILAQAGSEEPREGDELPT
jgi:Tfp pilus assembly PilM family ATPase